MIELIDEFKPVARKEHRCNYCGGIIHKGVKYKCQTIKFEGEVYRWKSHLHCSCLANKIEPNEEGGIDEEDFEEWINDYVHDNHFNISTNDIESNWKNKTYSELSEMVYREIK